MEVRHHNTIFDNIHLTIVWGGGSYSTDKVVIFFTSMSKLDSLPTKLPHSWTYGVFSPSTSSLYSPATKVNIVSNIAKDGD